MAPFNENSSTDKKKSVYKIFNKMEYKLTNFYTIF